jgi:hypothetical protein
MSASVADETDETEQREERQKNWWGCSSMCQSWAAVVVLASSGNPGEHYCIFFVLLIWQHKVLSIGIGIGVKNRLSGLVGAEEAPHPPTHPPTPPLSSTYYYRRSGLGFLTITHTHTRCAPSAG